MSDNESAATIGAEEGMSKRKYSRAERKARKMLLKNSEKCMDNVSRVVFRQTDDSLYVIDNPEVYKHPRTGTFIVFGEIDAVNSNPDEWQPAKAAKEINSSIAASQAPAKMQTNPELSEGEEDEDEKGTEIDESGLEPLDIELVMSQANVSRRKAVSALRKNGNDMVNTIMALTQ